MSKHEIVKKGESVPQQTFEQKMAAFRKATARPEQFILMCACAVKDKEFSVTLERYDAKLPFKIESIDKIMRSLEKPTGNVASVKERTFSADDIDLSGWKCPWCFNEEGVIRCSGCETWICSGATDRTGEKTMFHCRASCGSKGVVSTIKEVRGSDGRKSPPASQRPSLASAAKPLLSGSGGASLPKPGKR